ncbi:MAG: HDOD domain-containing protein [Peptococcaceae bacterium]|jgi:EAL and modified HD-GYP domain-containing signal transduction protein|nr:HDOD domain-containing protein [Peptococcaceae bacterium]
MEVFVARQPIFYRNGKVFAYELLFRHNENNYYENSDADRATVEVITNSFLTIGMKVLTGGKRGFINFTENLLKKSAYSILPKKFVVIELLETVEPNSEVVACCKKLKAAGYLLALDDFVFDPKYQPLIELADIIKIDFLATPLAKKSAIFHQIPPNSKIRILAEKVETYADFEAALHMGYHYFQGYYFSKPAIFTGNTMPANKAYHFQLLQKVYDETTSFEQLEVIFKNDPALSFQLLKFINSSFFAFSNRITSLRQALALLGFNELKKWTTLVSLQYLCQDKPNELMITSIIRAKFAESIAFKITHDLQSAAQAFLVGMFSLLDAFLDQPMTDILNQLPLADNIKSVLLGGSDSLLSGVYQLITAYEQADWDHCSHYCQAINFPEHELPGLYAEALDSSSNLLFSP